MKGNVVGVAAAYLRKGQDLNFAIPLERVLILKRIKPMTLDSWSNPRRKPTALDLAREGLASMKLGDCEQGLLSFDLAIKKKPDYAAAWWGVGTCLLISNSTDEGIAALKKSSQTRSSSFASAYYTLGLAYAEEGQRDPAYEEYESLKRLDPGLAQKLKEQLPK